MVRCLNIPIVIIKESNPGKDGRCGSMSLCAQCWLVAVQQLGNDAFTSKHLGPVKLRTSSLYGTYIAKKKTSKRV